jgi:hypothetical protein
MTALPDLPLVLREMRPDDVAFVVDTWVRSLPPRHWMPEAEYRTNMRRSVACMLERGGRHIVLASSEHESAIMGWAVGSEGVVHHAYVRPKLRRGQAAKAWVDALVQAARGAEGCTL